VVTTAMVRRKNKIIRWAPLLPKDGEGEIPGKIGKQCGAWTFFVSFTYKQQHGGFSQGDPTGPFGQVPKRKIIIIIFSSETTTTNFRLK
jgi:hypothetical protein